MITLIFSEVGPADIQVVAGLGDYLVSGAGALANTTSDTFRDFPQVSFATGDCSVSLVSSPHHQYSISRRTGRLENCHNNTKPGEDVQPRPPGILSR